MHLDQIGLLNIRSIPPQISTSNFNQANQECFLILCQYCHITFCQEHVTGESFLLEAPNWQYMTSLHWRSSCTLLQDLATLSSLSQEAFYMISITILYAYWPPASIHPNPLALRCLSLAGMWHTLIILLCPSGYKCGPIIGD